MAIRRSLRAATILLSVAAPLLVLTACGDDNDTPTSEADQLTVSDQWVKAAPDGMTSAFGTFTNTGDRQVRIVSASSAVAASTELHEVVESGGTSTMREKKDGFAVPAGKSLTLKPGAEHIMLMGLKQPITTGESVQIELRFADGSTQTVTALARDFSGNQEDYQP